MSEISSGPKHDSQEDDPKLAKIIKEAAQEAKKRILGGRPFKRGDGHAIWAEQKKILKEKGIDWKSPGEMNPNIIFD